MKNFLFFSVVGLGFLWFSWFVLTTTYQFDKTKIDSWAVIHNYKVKDIVQCIWDRGPFWIRHKGQRIYKITLEDGKIYWMRTGIFENEFLEE